MSRTYIIKMKLSQLLSSASPVVSSKFHHWRCFRKRLDLRHPVTLNEKITWLKLKCYAQSPLVRLCTDKLEVRRYVTAMGYPEILNRLLGVWERPEDIPFDDLPEAFVLKCNHGCGFNCLCPDKTRLDKNEARAQLARWLRTDHWRVFAELQYRDIPRRIICENYLGEGEHVPLDYKVYCFNGQALYILACDERDSGTARFYFFDRQWNFCPITRDGQKAPPGFSLKKPDTLASMLACAETLSAPFPFVRADFYEYKGNLIFGELTFTPAAGLDTGRLPEVDLAFGKLLRLDTCVVDPSGELYQKCMETELMI